MGLYAKIGCLQMTYQEALRFVEDNKYRIGTVDDKDFIVSQLLIVPSDKALRESYLMKFIQSPLYIIDSSVLVDKDVEVWAVDTSHIRNANVLFYNKLA